ncbi:MAG: TRAP transporter small permease [Bacteroidota bacterium]
MSKVIRLLEYVLVVLITIMTIDVIWQVASRYLFQSPSSFTDELAGFLLVWVGLLGAAYALGKRAHLAIDILPKKLEGRSRVALLMIIECCITLFSIGVMVIGGTNLVYLTFTLEQKSASLQIPLGYVYIILPISGLLMAYFSLNHMLESRKDIVK